MGHFERLPFALRSQVPWGAVGVDTYSADPLGGRELTRLLMVDPRWFAKPVSVVSLLIDPEELDDLLSNTMKCGRVWERSAHFALLRHGELFFASPAGLRIHGGASRQRRIPNFRLYFRGSYDSRPPDLPLLTL